MSYTKSKIPYIAIVALLLMIAAFDTFVVEEEINNSVTVKVEEPVEQTAASAPQHLEIVFK